MSRFLMALWEASLGRRGAGGMLAHLLFLPLSLAYRAGLAFSRAGRRARPKFARHMPVVIVGNLTTGGTGKTPQSVRFASLLEDAGFRPAILSRGYGGRRKADPAVVFAGGETLLSPEEAGDEPAMMARWLLRGKSCLVVGRDRVAAGEMAVARLGATALVLDDGFQQRMRFPGAWRVVMVNAAAPFGNGALLPAGNLREPASALADADAVVLSHANWVGEAGLLAVRERIRDLAPAAVQAGVGYDLAALDAPGGGALEPSALKGKKVMAISAIGYPEGFERMLERWTGQPVVPWRRPDHFKWTVAGYVEAIKAGMEAGCDLFVTTSKDYGKMDRLAAASPADAPVHTLYSALVGVGDIFGGAELEAALTGYLARFKG